mmetsp:Transcript_23633/g.41882  ORF Transcript_23633/g.41882 Transcript_23633/m.41882 type:complete len:822 (-) Transcript_23633:22-2487(-)
MLSKEAIIKMKRNPADLKLGTQRKSDVSSDNDFDLDRGDFLIQHKKPNPILAKGVQLQGKSTGPKVTSINLAGGHSDFVADLEGLVAKDAAADFFARKSMSSDNSAQDSKLTFTALNKHNQKFEDSDISFEDSGDPSSSESESMDSTTLKVLTANTANARAEPVAQKAPIIGGSFSSKSNLPSVPAKDQRQQRLGLGLELKANDRPFVIEKESSERVPKPVEVKNPPPVFNLNPKANDKPEVSVPDVNPKQQQFAFEAKGSIPSSDVNKSSFEPKAAVGLQRLQPSGSISSQNEVFFEAKPPGKHAPGDWANAFEMESNASETFQAKSKDKDKPEGEELKQSKFEPKLPSYPPGQKFSIPEFKFSKGEKDSSVTSEESEKFEVKQPNRQSNAPRQSEVIEVNFERKPVVIPPLPLIQSGPKYDLSSGQTTSELKGQPPGTGFDGKARLGGQPTAVFRLGEPQAESKPVEVPAAKPIQFSTEYKQQSLQVTDTSSPNRHEQQAANPIKLQPYTPAAIILQPNLQAGPQSQPQVSQPSIMKRQEPQPKPESAGIHLNLQASPAPSVPAIQPPQAVQFNLQLSQGDSLDYNTICTDILKLDLSREIAAAQLHEKKPGCWDCFLSCFGCTTEELLEAHRPHKDRILALGQIPLNPSNSLHQRILIAFYRSANQSNDVVAIEGDHWRENGFTENRPFQELGNSGLLLMNCLLYICASYPKLTHEIIFVSKSRATAFSWATLGAKLAYECMIALRNGRLNASFNTYKPNDYLFHNLFCGAYLHCFRLYSKSPAVGLDACIKETCKVLGSGSERLFDEINAQREEERR